MQSILKRIITVLMIGALFPMAGCSTLFNSDTRVMFNFDVAPDINPNGAGRPSPVVVSIFELEDSRQFSQEDFIHLYEDPKKYLGKDLIKKRSLKEFTPAYNRDTQFVADPRTRYVGLLVEFSQYDKSEERLVLEVRPKSKNSFNVRLSNLSIEITDGRAHVKSDSASKSNADSEFDF